MKKIDLNKSPDYCDETIITFESSTSGKKGKIKINKKDRNKIIDALKKLKFQNIEERDFQ